MNQIDATEDRTIFYIPDMNLKAFEAACAKLSRKAVKIGCSEIKPFVFGYQMKKINGVDIKVYEVLFTVEAPKVNGWTFVARLDHSNETGNIIRMVLNTIDTIPEKYRTCAPHCDHCNLTRRRRDTFVLRCNDTNEFKSVGSSCLVDFFGHDPIRMARMAELLGYAHEAGRAAEDYSNGSLIDLRWFNVEEFCTLAAVSIRHNGWISGKAVFENPALISTRNVASKMYIERELRAVTDADRALASEALQWAASLREQDTLTDYESNILVVSEAQYIEQRSLGLAASIVGVFFQARQKQQGSASKHIGEVGAKITGNVTITACNAVNGNYGTTFIYRMLSDKGDVLVWFSSNNVGVADGSKVVLKGTVKQHSEFKGVKQTVVTRCKFLTADR